MRVAGILTAAFVGTAVVIVQPAATALTPQEIGEIARQITVQIDGKVPGSGVIIERQGNIYTVVTCEHVVRLGGNYTVRTPDGKQYTFKQSQVKPFPGVDLATFQFTSTVNYRVAEKGNSDQVTLGTNISVAGYPQGTFDIRFLRGAVSSRVTNPNDGYAFVYDVGGFPGMSGGAILDDQGKLIGIHGLAKTRLDTNATTVYGIPLKTYLTLAPSAQLVGVAPAPKLTNRLVSTVPLASKFTLVKTLIGHSRKLNSLNQFKGIVFSVAFSPDGKTLASGGFDNTITIWNVVTGQEISTLNGHSISVDSVAFSPNGKTLASGSSISDNTIKIWNVVTGQEISTLKATSNYNSVAFSPDGKTLASGSWDNTIKIWNVATGQEIATLRVHSDLVDSVAFSPSGKTLASGSQDKTIKIWNVATGKEISTLNGHSSSVNSVAFSPDGKTLTSGSSDNTIKIWNVATGKEISTLNGHSSSVNSVAFSPDGKTLASGSDDNTIKIWNVATGQEISTLKGHSDAVHSVAFSPDGKTLASGSWDKTIKIWQLSQ
ncbi:trypsin-like peptidase domain-containing protein [Aetokthonos hydrillicola Thurmond2011]|jgi:WD40 repeat protein|uniref:Trypsin-like peptidase domain-containing protein n=1 Tax=Aetokthonos hydrillicola Thurmond2011 TaxID=2712845 RepID=A0AAP5IAS5_9CYAN|nr:trypsin-like peptidase domain-containing protein [Aetokthonos hydrillicola]MBO3460980.1 serine/threonine protein kinase [Aetokthonos hydrillicola CCALA 1050]MBW4583654.1 trypsin-like peptidase domain-containing protein [Aetokthonos hydrillicola CCALA 1050]MDR9895650.1 trypsin-like peptidase domain-containing protein [Aetokthonos hydrillicola Thurmond2011]